MSNLAPLPRVSDIVEASQGTIEVSHSMGSGDPRLSDADLLLTVLHNGTLLHKGKDTLPDAVMDLFPDMRQLYEYVSVERDTGTTQVADVLQSIRKGVLALHILPPRGIVDANRLEHCALSVEFPQTKDAEHARELLLTMHRQMHAAIQLAIAGTKDDGGKGCTILDLHSMSPRTPNGKAPVTRYDNLREHVAHWVRGSQEGALRPIDLIDATADKKIIGDRNLSLQLQAAFRSQKFVTELNEPYAKSRLHHPPFIDERGVSIDWTKDQLTSSPRGQPFNLMYCQSDGPKIARHARVLDDVLRLPKS